MSNTFVFDKNATVLITGGTGLVGRALGMALAADGFVKVVSIGSRDCSSGASSVTPPSVMVRIFVEMAKTIYKS